MSHSSWALLLVAESRLFYNRTNRTTSSVQEAFLTDLETVKVFCQPKSDMKDILGENIYFKLYFFFLFNKYYFLFFEIHIYIYTQCILIISTPYPHLAPPMSPLTFYVFLIIIIIMVIINMMCSCTYMCVLAGVTGLMWESQDNFR